MHLDISRDTFGLVSSVSHLLMQQGRLVVDADWNEQSAVFLRLVRTLAADLIGWHGGPGVNGNPISGAFGLERVEGHGNRFSVLPGRYYIDGLQIDVPPGSTIEVPTPEDQTGWLLYVEAWESPLRRSFALEQSDPAFEGLDTVVRAVVQWRIGRRRIELPDDDQFDPTREQVLGWVGPLRVHPALAARVRQSEPQVVGCSTPTQAAFNGLENQLYRVEIHRAGPFWDGRAETSATAATFKWSRDNGSVAFAADPAISPSQGVAHLDESWLDERSAIAADDVVELIDERSSQSSLVRIESVKDGDLKFALPVNVDDLPKRVTLVRRWDHRWSEAITSEGGLLIPAGKPTGNPPTDLRSAWIPLEDGVEVQFSLGQQNGDEARLAGGDHWLIPARASTANIVWPESSNHQPRHLLARVMERFYAPIGLAKRGDEGITILNLRRAMKSVAARP